MSLSRYRSKRNFAITPEPPPRTERSSGKNLSYFIQRHHARALHYDFRLELGGVLKSWAVPKGPSLDPADKRLAVAVEDHPYAYGSFEGTIPAKQYGAGEVVLWDRGHWLPLGDPVAGLRRGRLEFELHGVKLGGRWILVRMDQHEGKQENWLLMKQQDAQARTGRRADITARRPGSVGGRRVQAPAAAPPSGSAGTRWSGAMPAIVDAQLATLTDHAPEGEQWLSELKFDGYRGLCRIDHGRAHIFTRGHLDWSARWPQLINALAALQVTDAWIDGEVVALLDDGSISFEALQDQTSEQATGLALYVFDLLWHNGDDLRALPLTERKRRLRDVVPGVDGSGLIRLSEHVCGDAAAVYRHACRHALEGIVIKRADAPYTGRRDRHWLKMKCALRQEFVIGGYTDPAGSRQGFGALLVGVFDSASARLHYAGRVGTGFDQRTLTALLQRFRKLKTSRSPFADPLPARQAQGVHWIRPVLVAEVTFSQWTRAGVVRHGAFVGLREDKKAAEVVRERPSSGMATATTSPSRAAEIAGIRLTRPDKMLYTDPVLTKHDLADYYLAVARWLLPHLHARPVTMVRCPEGSNGKCFFQRHPGKGTPTAVQTIAVPGGGDCMLVDDAAALVATVQMGVLELHTWGASADSLLQPDRVTFDLDPAPDLPWARVVEAARLLHEVLGEAGLDSFVKTTGGKGLHVVLPIVPEHDWEVVKAWSHSLASYLARGLPEYFTANMAKSARQGKIFIDYLRNAAGATAVAAYSPRARPGAPVSAPLHWDELKPDIVASHFNVCNMPARLAALKRDPWQGYGQNRQQLTRRILRAFDTKRTAT